MGFPYVRISFLIALVGVGASIYSFLNENDEDGRFFLFLSLMSLFGFYYILKTLYYLRYHATFNEVSFVIVLPIIPVIQLIFKEFLEINVESLITIEFGLNEETLQLAIDRIDFLLAPYYFFSVFLLLRANLRYPFIRLKGYSERGFPSRLVSILLTAGIPLLYLLFGFVILQNGLLVIFALIYAMVGIMGLFV